MRKPRKPRTYDASGRRRRAAEGQERVLEAGRRLFEERGYAETTMGAIASEAGVALPTLYATFHSKAGVLSRLVGRLVSGEPGRPILQTGDAKQVLAEVDPRRALALFAAHMNQILARVGPVYEAIKTAARADAELAEVFERAQKGRSRNLEAIAVKLGDRDELREGLSVADAGRTIWVLASAEVRQLLLAQAGWSAEKYEAWLSETLAAALLR